MPATIHDLSNYRTVHFTGRTIMEELRPTLNAAKIAKDKETFENFDKWATHVFKHGSDAFIEGLRDYLDELSDKGRQTLRLRREAREEG